MHSSIPKCSDGKGLFLRMKILSISPDIHLSGLLLWPSAFGRNMFCVKGFHIQPQKQFASSQSL